MSDTTKADDRETPSEATSGYSSMASFRDATDKSTTKDAESSTKDTSSDRISAKKKVKDSIAELKKFRDFNLKDTSDVEVCSFFVGEYFKLHPETPEEEIISKEQLVATIHDYARTCREKLDNEIISDLVLKGRMANLWNRFLRDGSSIIDIVNLIETLILEFEISINEKKREVLERKKSDKSPTEEMQTAEGDKPIEDASVTAIKGSPSTTSPEDDKPIKKDTSVTSIKGSTATTSPEGDKPMEEDALVTSIKGSTATTSPEGEKPMEEDASVASIKGSTATTSPEGEKPMEEDASVASIKGPTATTSAAVASGSSSITKEFRSKWLKEMGRSIEESVEIVIQYYFQSERIERDLYNALQTIENRKTTTDTKSDEKFSEQLLEEGYLKESQKFIRTLKLLIRATLMLHKRRSKESFFSQEDSKGCQESKTEAVSQETVKQEG